MAFAFLLSPSARIPAARAAAANAAPEALAAPLAPPFAHPPLAGTLTLTDGYGAVRSNHFHAGVDLSTQGRVGAEVRAPLAGTVVRVRASGVGYGRGLYLKCDDGRTIVFGHLDAFVPAIAAYMDSAQRASGRYEQDLEPAPGRFRFAAGALVAWSGESGAGGPHLHLEVRHGDFALHPLRAGLVVADHTPPILDALTLEPMDGDSYVRRCASPFTQPLAADGETLIVTGRVRAVVRAHDPAPGARDLPPWSVAMSFAGLTTEARFDSISWDGEMSQLGLVMDQGRVVGHGAGGSVRGDGIILDAPEGVRPRFLRGDPTEQDSLRKRVGVIEVRPGAAARPLTLTARDAAGLSVTKRVWLRGPRGGEGPDTTLAHGVQPPAALPRWSFAALPDKWVRIRVTGTPPALSHVRIERGRDGELGASATWDGEGWCALLHCKGIPDEDGFWIKAQGKDGKAWWSRGSYTLWPAGADLPIDESPLTRMAVTPACVFEGGVVMGSLLPPEKASAGEWRALTPVVVLEPADWPLAKPAALTLKAPEGMDVAHVVVAKRAGAAESWDWIRSSYDSTTRVFTAETGTLGQFALMRDATPPRVTLIPPARIATAGPYSRWQLTAHASDGGSGIDAERSAIIVDGKRVPTEYDPEAHVLRWRPLVLPAAGRHELVLEAVDRAGNRARTTGVFVLDSAHQHR